MFSIYKNVNGLGYRFIEVSTSVEAGKNIISQYSCFRKLMCIGDNEFLDTHTEVQYKIVNGKL